MAGEVVMLPVTDMTHHSHVHVPPPENVKEKRRKALFYDRIKILVIIAVVFGFVVVKRKADVPIMSWAEVLREQLRAKWWLVVLACLEAIRQVHYFISERSAGYNAFWTQHVWGAWDRRVSRMNPWRRYRYARLWRWIWLGSIAAVILAAIWGVPVLTAISEAPSRIWDAAFATATGMPMIIYIFFIVGISIIQFAAIFWFMSKGGVDTYMPAEIKTRFSDVWGQDQVVAKVKENIVFLENPEAIESKGGYVPGGLLLWGPPGTGKTLMAEAVAGETGKPYVFVDPGAFINMFMGVGILKVKGLYRRLRKLALKYGGVIVFFDEADSLGSRGALAGGFDRMAADQRFSDMRWLSDPAQQILVHHYAPSYADKSADHDPPRRKRDRVIMSPGMGGGGMGTLQALLTEMSGLKKPRGFINRRVRQFLGMKPKDPPKYRILHMMATNMPNTLDEAMLRPGRIDRIYKVGYPSKDGRVRTYQGYFAKIKHTLSDEDIERLAVMTPYATGASIKDVVNESLVIAIRDGRDTVEWTDVLKAKHQKELGLPEDVEYIERERHAIAIHEACHAVAAYRTRQHWTIDVATIEKGGTYLGMVSSVKPEDQFTRWRTEYESDIIVSLASLAGERLFFNGDNSSGVSGDLDSATTLATYMEGYWGMGSTIASQGVAQNMIGQSWGGKRSEDGKDPAWARLGVHIEVKLQDMFQAAEQLLVDNRTMVFALAHALETHKTISGQDVSAIMNGTRGPVVDGRVYHTPFFADVAEHYHSLALVAHDKHTRIEAPLPVLPAPPEAGFVGSVTGNGNGNGHRGWGPPPPPGAWNAKPLPPPSPR
jgi:cell division protease FtsH